jgi:hypothetical protein
VVTICASADGLLPSLQRRIEQHDGVDNKQLRPAAHLALLRGRHHLCEYGRVACHVGEERDELAEPALRVLEPLLHAARGLVALLQGIRYSGCAPVCNPVCTPAVCCSCLLSPAGDQMLILCAQFAPLHVLLLHAARALVAVLHAAARCALLSVLGVIAFWAWLADMGTFFLQ